MIIEKGKEKDELPRATGIEFQTGSGEIIYCWAGKEVILCAGAIASPKLLMLSGVGDRVALQRLGIACVSDVPAVGKNLQDHPVM